MVLENKIIDGKSYAAEILAKLTANIAVLPSTAGLAIVVVGENTASQIYVRNKLKAAEKVGIKAYQINLPSEVSNKELVAVIHELNMNKDISGIIVQLPLPSHIEKGLILTSISPEKDVDGFHPINVGYLHSDIGQGFVPCTALGCIELIKKCEPNLSGKNAVVIGRSNIVGRPVAAMLLKENCTVTICHSGTKDLSNITNRADIVVSAVGKPKFLTTEYFNKNAIVIDVGISRDPENQAITGDVDFQNVHANVAHITPVPRGVGPMTIAFLLVNTFKAYCKQNNITELL